MRCACTHTCVCLGTRIHQGQGLPRDPPPPLAPVLPLLLEWTAADSDSSAPRLRPHQLGTPLKYPAHPLPDPYSFLSGVSSTKHQLPEAQPSIRGTRRVCIGIEVSIAAFQAQGPGHLLTPLPPQNQTRSACSQAGWGPTTAPLPGMLHLISRPQVYPKGTDFRL